MNLIPKKKYKVSKDKFMEMVIVVVYVDTTIFDYEGYWNNKWDFNRLLSEEEFISLKDKYKEMAIVFAYITTKYLGVYEENIKELFLNKMKQFFKEEKYSMFKYEIIESLINKFQDSELKENDMEEIYKYWVDNICKEYNIVTEEKRKEVRKIVEMINFQIIRKINRMYEVTKIKKEK